MSKSAKTQRKIKKAEQENIPKLAKKLTEEEQGSGVFSTEYFNFKVEGYIERLRDMYKRARGM